MVFLPQSCCPQLSCWTGASCSVDKPCKHGLHWHNTGRTYKMWLFLILVAVFHSKLQSAIWWKEKKKNIKPLNPPSTCLLLVFPPQKHSLRFVISTKLSMISLLLLAFLGRRKWDANAHFVVNLNKMFSFFVRLGVRSSEEDVVTD